MNKPDIKADKRDSSVRRFWHSSLLAPFNQVQGWNRLAASINPLWSLNEARARVVRVVDEAKDIRSIWLKPNRHFQGFHAGQHVLLELEIKGARHGRCFSFSAAPRVDGLIRLTIKLKNNGVVSPAAHALKTGQIVRLSQAIGNFVPKNSNSPLLMLSAGSGVTPMMALLQQFANDGSVGDVVLVHCGQHEDDLLFANELNQLAKESSKLVLHLHATQAKGRLDASQIAHYVPDWQTRETMLCGPDGFMQMVEQMYREANCLEALQSESFGRRAAPVDIHAAEYMVTSKESTFSVNAGQTLLDGAEAAGLTPRFGCRRGICRSCQCKKLSGTVTNLLTGQASGPGEELIQLCISSPQSALELAL